MIAVGFFRRGRTFGPAHGKPGNDQRWNVGKVMNGIADERDRVACVARDQFGCDKDERRNHGERPKCPSSLPVAGERANAHPGRDRGHVRGRVIVAMGMVVHRLNSTRWPSLRTAPLAFVTQVTNSTDWKWTLAGMNVFAETGLTSLAATAYHCNSFQFSEIVIERKRGAANLRRR